MASRITRRLHRWLSSPIDAAGIALFRVVFGVAMTVEVWRYWQRGWFESSYLGGSLHFSFPGFAWIHTLPALPVMMVQVALVASAICIALGLLYRLAAAVFALFFSYVFLFEATQYLNHFYLISLLSFLLIFIPSHTVFSIDRILAESLLKGKNLHSKIVQFFLPTASSRSSFVGQWAQALLAFQVGVAYFYGGVAKLLTPDWMQGYPMRFWIVDHGDLPIFGPYVKEMWMALFMSNAGMLFDLLVVPLTVWRRTRWLGVLGLLIFNTTNMQLFHIGVFPWLMLGSIPLFFEPDWIRRVWDRLTLPTATAAMLAEQRVERLREIDAPRIGTTGMALLCCYVAFQVLFPLRHLLYSGNVQWTSEGGLFSWHMKLSDRRGHVSFRVLDRTTGVTTTVDPRPFLKESQKPEIATDPDLMLQFAHVLRDRFAKGHPENIAVFVDAFVSLNGRPMERLINPTTDLAHTERTFFGHAPWILQLQHALPDNPQVLSPEGGSADD